MVVTELELWQFKSVARVRIAFHDLIEAVAVGVQTVVLFLSLF